MQSASIWGREVIMQGSPLTYLEYKREFGGDLANDLTDVYTAGKADTATMLKFAWAMAKTHDPSISKFEAWISEFDLEGFSVLQSPIGVIDSAICAELFRLRPPKRFNKLREVIARWLERLSQHFSSQASRLFPR